MAFRKLISLVGCLSGLPLGGCRCGTYDRTERWASQIKASDLSFHIDEKDFCDCDADLDKRTEWYLFAFGDLPRFTAVGQTVERLGYATVTFLDTNQAVAGKYSMQARLGEGSTGGPPGSAWEYFADITGAHYVGRLAMPQAPPGIRPILPGQLIVRKLSDSEFLTFADRYLIELPANQDVLIDLDPIVPNEEQIALAKEDPSVFVNRDCYRFDVGVWKDGQALSVRNNHRKEGDYFYHFDSTSAGQYEIRISAGKEVSRRPDRYTFNVFWGKELRNLNKASDTDVQWHESAGAASEDGIKPRKP